MPVGSCVAMRFLGVARGIPRTRQYFVLNGLLDLFHHDEHLVTYERGNASSVATIAQELL